MSKVGLILLAAVAVAASFLCGYHKYTFEALTQPWLADVLVSAVGACYVAYLAYTLVAIGRERKVTRGAVLLLVGTSTFLIVLTWLLWKSDWEWECGRSSRYPELHLAGH